MRQRRAFAFGTDAWDPSHRFETSWLLSPWLLFSLRALFCLYIFTTLIFELIFQCVADDDGCKNSNESFSYFTVLTYWGIGFYFLVSSIHTFTYAKTGVPLLDRFPRPLQALHSTLYTTITTFPFIVTIVYWVMLFDGTPYPSTFALWSNVSKHAMNLGFAVFEIFIPRTDTPPVVHIIWLVLILALYLGVAYIKGARTGEYPYNFLNPAKQGAKVAAYVCGIAIGAAVIFGIVWGLIWLRKFVTEKKLGKTGKFSARNKHAEVVDVEMSAAHMASK
ncbi:hypothetical protein V8F06_002050 [Rhypophila decipiens]